MSLSYVDRQTLSVLAPTITKALGISDVGYGWLGSAFSLAYLAGGPLAGMWIDRVGARRGLLAAVVAWSVVAALQAAAPGFGALVAMRLALGLAESPTFPGGVQTVQRGLPEGTARAACPCSSSGWPSEACWLRPSRTASRAASAGAPPSWGPARSPRRGRRSGWR